MPAADWEEVGLYGCPNCLGEGVNVETTIYCDENSESKSDAWKRGYLAAKAVEGPVTIVKGTIPDYILGFMCRRESEAYQAGRQSVTK